MGHHLDDAVETFFLNLLFQRKLEPLKALTPSQAGVSTIRPMILVEERKVEAWVAEAGISPVACPVCDDYPLSQRRNIKELLRSFESLQPDFRASVRDALYNAGT
jgi:tRNA 2-thiocytidine biosynthesis protein TtcA